MASVAEKKALAEGADEIRAAQKEVDGKAKVVPIVDKFTDKDLKATRDIKEVMKDRVEILPGSLGLKLKPETTIAENLQILDEVVHMEDHVQFMIGDVLNYGELTYGRARYDDVLHRTGRAQSTLYQYAQTARLIPFSKRIMELPFTQHRQLNPLGEFPDKLDNALAQIKERDSDLTVADVHAIVDKLKPKKKTTVTKGSKKGVQKEFETEALTKTEDKLLANVDAALDEAEDALTAARPLIFNIKKIDNEYKSELADRLEFFRKFQTEVIKRTGKR